MKIKYADHHKWVKNIPLDDVLGSFGDSNKEKLKSTLNKINEANITSIIEPVDNAFLEWFVPLYTDNIVKKDNPKIYPIREKVFNVDKQYLALKLYENELPIGATIFTYNGEFVSVAYRSYLNNWQEARLRANPSLYTEYLLEQHTRELNYKKILHGRDRNPYGANASIGLAIFKLSIGCQPYLSKSYELLELDTESCSKDVFVLEYPGNTKDVITKGYLITSKDTFNKWLPVTKYQHLVEIEVIYKD